MIEWDMLQTRFFTFDGHAVPCNEIWLLYPVEEEHPPDELRFADTLPPGVDPKWVTGFRAFVPLGETTPAVLEVWVLDGLPASSCVLHLCLGPDPDAISRPELRLVEGVFVRSDLLLRDVWEERCSSYEQLRAAMDVLARVPVDSREAPR